MYGGEFVFARRVRALRSMEWLIDKLRNIVMTALHWNKLNVAAPILSEVGAGYSYHQISSINLSIVLDLLKTSNKSSVLRGILKVKSCEIAALVLFFFLCHNRNFNHNHQENYTRHVFRFYKAS